MAVTNGHTYPYPHPYLTPPLCFFLILVLLHWLQSGFILRYKQLFCLPHAGLHLKFSGKAQVSFTRGSGRGKRRCWTKESYLKREVRLLPRGKFCLQTIVANVGHDFDTTFNVLSIFSFLKLEVSLLSTCKSQGIKNKCKNEKKKEKGKKRRGYFFF